jgi:hypothetical protein
MSEDTREELISAYIDGEVSPEERAQVEAWLAESSHLRQLHDELLALRSAVQSLGEHKLERELAPAVLRRAEHSVLRRTMADEETARAVRPGSIVSWWERGASWRRVMWPAIALAAALLILVFDAGRRGEQEVARAPEAPPVAGPAERAPAQRAADEAAPAERPSAVQELEKKSESLEMRQQNRNFAAPAGQGAQPQLQAPQADMPKSLDRYKARSGEPASVQAAPTDQASQVYQVPPGYLYGKEFENLLDQKKIKWVRLPEGQAPPADATASAPMAKREGLREQAAAMQNQATYYLFTTQKNVDDVFSAVPNNKKLTLQAFGTAQQQAPLYAKEGKPVKITIVAPELPEPPAPTSPAAAAEPPQR